MGGNSDTRIKHVYQERGGGGGIVREETQTETERYSERERVGVGAIHVIMQHRFSVYI